MNDDLRIVSIGSFWKYLILVIQSITGLTVIALLRLLKVFLQILYFFLPLSGRKDSLFSLRLNKISNNLDLLIAVFGITNGFFQNIKTMGTLYCRHGSGAVKQYIVNLLNKQRLFIPLFHIEDFDRTFIDPSYLLLSEKIVIIGEMSLLQCKKYRIDQRVEMFKDLGIDCSAVDWHESGDCLSAIQLASLVIFYRVAAFPEILLLITEAKRLNIPTFWEVDDLIFDKEVILSSKALAELDEIELDNIINLALLYKKAMLSCSYGIASTRGLAKAMREAGVPEVFVVENALDSKTLAYAAELDSKKDSDDGLIRIVYGSGTDTHNIDFLEASEAIQHILTLYDNVRFRIIGPLNLPSDFASLESKIERISFCSFDAYLRYIAECEISIAPLEKCIFNDAKSNIKFLEASVLKIPSVCSSMAAFGSVIQNGENGFLCNDRNEWISSFKKLIDDSSLRQKIAAKAYNTVIANYFPQVIANSQVLPCIERFKKERSKKRILSVNFDCNPHLSGGVAVVAEDIYTLSGSNQEFEVYVLTALAAGIAPQYSARRYLVGEITVIGISLPVSLPLEEYFENNALKGLCEEVITSVNPDFVQLHSINDIGRVFPEICKTKDIPYSVVLYDA
jgi:glycosyltransferase involved in cell wall biosynthesis